MRLKKNQKKTCQTTGPDVPTSCLLRSSWLIRSDRPFFFTCETTWRDYPKGVTRVIHGHTLAFIWALLFWVLLAPPLVQRQWNFQCGSSFSIGPLRNVVFLNHARLRLSPVPSLSHPVDQERGSDTRARRSLPSVSYLPGSHLRKHAARINLPSKHRPSFYSTPALLLAFPSNENVNGTRGAYAWS